jgi:hypothetical protein
VVQTVGAGTAATDAAFAAINAGDATVSDMAEAAEAVVGSAASISRLLLFPLLLLHDGENFIKIVRFLIKKSDFQLIHKLVK